MNSLTKLYSELEPYVIRLTYSKEQLDELQLSLEELEKGLTDKMHVINTELEAIGMSREEARDNIDRIIKAIEKYNQGNK